MDHSAGWHLAYIVSIRPFSVIRVDQTELVVNG